MQSSYFKTVAAAAVVLVIPSAIHRRSRDPAERKSVVVKVALEHGWREYQQPSGLIWDEFDAPLENPLNKMLHFSGTSKERRMKCEVVAKVFNGIGLVATLGKKPLNMSVTFRASAQRIERGEIGQVRDKDPVHPWCGNPR